VKSVSFILFTALFCQTLYAKTGSNDIDRFLTSIVVPKVQPSSNLTRVLFIGNSFSFYNNGIHNHLGSLIRSTGEWKSLQNRLRLSTLSGGHIKEHSADLGFFLGDPSQKWQAIVLQGHSNEPINSKKTKAFISAIADSIQSIKAKGIEPLIFMTWGYKNQTAMGVDLANVYTKLANKLDVLVVPVGVAFAIAEMALSHIELFVPDVLSVDSEGVLTYRKDWKHPSEAGTYLAACVFYATLNQRSPEGIIFTGQLRKDTALALQKLSWQVTQQFFKRKNNEME
tara:strand:- start:479344 stop:480192 length:849 start_codon:yes stop_codon:yes gene_type:complete